jgi:hypothetical protein
MRDPLRRPLGVMLCARDRQVLRRSLQIDHLISLDDRFVTRTIVRPRDEPRRQRPLREHNPRRIPSALADEAKARELIAKATAQRPEIEPKKPNEPKAPKTTASITRGTTAPSKSKASVNVGKEAPSSSWWSWLWGGSADQASGKKAKP